MVRRDPGAEQLRVFVGVLPYDRVCQKLGESIVGTAMAMLLEESGACAELLGIAHDIVDNAHGGINALFVILRNHSVVRVRGRSRTIRPSLNPRIRCKKTMTDGVRRYALLLTTGISNRLAHSVCFSFVDVARLPQLQRTTDVSRTSLLHHMRELMSEKIFPPGSLR